MRRNHYRRVVVCAFLVFCNFSVAFAEPFRYDGHSKRDPFIPLKVAEQGRRNLARVEELRINGIVYEAQGNSLADINDVVVRPGDTVAGFLVVAIDQNKVTVSRDGEEYQLAITEEY